MVVLTMQCLGFYKIRYEIGVGWQKTRVAGFLQRQRLEIGRSEFREEIRSPHGAGEHSSTSVGVMALLGASEQCSTVGFIDQTKAIVQLVYRSWSQKNHTNLKVRLGSY